MTQVSLLPGVKIKNKRSAKEEKIQLAVCRYLKMQYPRVLFICDVAAGIKLPVKWAGITKTMRSNRGMPDLYILHSKIKPGERFDRGNRIDYTATEIYVGLAIELKKESIFKKDGSLKSRKTAVRNKRGMIVETYDHIAEQAEILSRLRSQGWKAEFACSFEEAKKLIDDYLKSS